MAPPRGAVAGRPCQLAAELGDGGFPDGKAYNLSEGVLRRRYTPEAPTEITLALWPTSNVFLPGHRLRLEVASSSFPRFDRHPDTLVPGEAAVSTQRAAQRVFHGPARLSRLLLPVVPPTGR